MIDKDKLLADMTTNAKAAMEAAGPGIVSTIDGIVEQQVALLEVGMRAAAKTAIQGAITQVIEDALKSLPSAGIGHGFNHGGPVTERKFRPVFGDTNCEAIIKGLPK